MSNQDEARPAIPPALAAAIAHDFQPVRPLLSPAQRSLIAGATAAAAGLTLIGALGVRETVSPLLAASFSVRFALGAGLVAIALREGVPSEGVSAATRKVAAALGVAGLFILPFLLPRSGSFDPSDSLCYWLVLLAAAPAGALLTFLLGRAYPLRTVFTMGMACLGTGYLADVAASLVCSSGNVGHAYVFHGGAVATLTIAGTAMGWLLRAAQRKSGVRRP